MHPLAVVIRRKQGFGLEFAAEDQVCFSRETVIIKEKTQKTLHNYQQKDCTYKEKWSENLPPDVNTASIIAVVQWQGRKLLLQDKSTSTTLALSCDGGELLGRWHDEGILLTCLRDALVYAVEKTEGEYEIVIDDWEQTSRTRLQPVTGKPTWSHPYLSVCYPSWKHRMVVTSAANRSLDIYQWDMSEGK